MSLTLTSSNLVWDEEAGTPVLLSQWAGSISSSQLVPRCSESLAKLSQCRSLCWYQLRTLQYSGREPQTVSKRGGNQQLSCPVAKPFVSSRKRKIQSWETNYVLLAQERTLFLFSLRVKTSMGNSLPDT